MEAWVRKHFTAAESCWKIWVACIVDIVDWDERYFFWSQFSLFGRGAKAFLAGKAQYRVGVWAEGLDLHNSVSCQRR